MKIIHTHEECSTLQQQVLITAMDDLVPGQLAHSQYSITTLHENEKSTSVLLSFWRGRALPLDGITDEALLAVLIDRFEGYRNSAYAGLEISMALKNMRAAMTHLADLNRRLSAEHIDDLTKQ
jgi:hypothetical protein